MVQLPGENERKEGGGGGKKNGWREGTRRPETGSASTEAFTALAEDGLEVTGLPLCHFSPPHVVLPPLHLALRAPLPICSANQAHSFLRGVERECGLMGLGEPSARKHMYNS